MPNQQCQSSDGKAVSGRYHCSSPCNVCWLWPPCIADADIIFLSCFVFFFYSSPNLSRSEMCCMRLAGNVGPKKSPKIRQLGTIAQLCRAMSSQLRHVLTIGKNLLNSNVSPTFVDNMVNFGPLAAEICWQVCGTPGYFNGFHVLTVLLHSTQVVGVSQSLWRWTEDATYIWQGGRHFGHWPTFLV